MAQALTDFIKDAYRAGKTRQDIHAVLKEAGWREEQLQEAWNKYRDIPFPVPVPVPTAYASPRLTAVNLFYFVVLYTAIYATVAILFTFLDYHLPDIVNQRAGYSGYSAPIGEAIRGYLSALIVSVPLVALSQHLSQKMMAASRQFIPGIRLKLLNLTLFIAAVITLCDFISVVYYFLSGELSLRFAIKATILLFLCVGLYYYFKPEMQANENKA
jgi:hypothetical protein